MGIFEDIKARATNRMIMMLVEQQALTHFGLTSREQASTLPVEKKKEIFNYLVTSFFQHGGVKL